jgi:SET domain-containing protein
VKLWLWVGKSPNEGKGVFTAQDIKKDTRIIRYIGEKIPNPSSPPNPKRWKSVKALNSQTQAF